MTTTTTISVHQLLDIAYRAPSDEVLSFLESILQDAEDSSAIYDPNTYPISLSAFEDVHSWVSDVRWAREKLGEQGEARA